MRLASAMLAMLLFGGSAAAELVDGIAAIVDDEVILLSEVEDAAAMVLRRIEAEHGSVPRDVRLQVLSQALQALIDEKLIEDAATRLGLEATDREIDDAVASIAREEGLGVEELYAAAQRQGLPREAYRKKLREEITRMKVISTVAQTRVEVTEEDIQKAFESRYAGLEPGLRVRGRHILLGYGPEESDEGRRKLHERAVELREEALAGRDFGMLARQYSDAPSAVEGGMTVFRKGEVAPELRPYVFGMQPGEISPPVHTRHGVNLIQVLERFDPSRVKLADVRREIETELMDRKTQEEFKPWLAELRENRYVEVVAPELR